MWEWVKNIMKPEALEAWTGTVSGGIASMRKRLAKEAEIRIYVDNTPNFGNQASSVLLMKTLIDSYGFSGEDKKVTLLYKNKDAKETRKKLSVLLQGFDDTKPDATATYENVAIRFMTVEALMADGGIGVINFGFAGGADKGDEGDEKTNNWFAKNSKVNFFLRLQAYLWPYPQQIQYGGANVAAQTYDLDANVGGGDTFQQTGWYILDKYWEPSAADWSYYQNGSNPGVDAGTVIRTGLAEVLVNFLVANKDAVRFLPLYGIKAYPNQTGVVPWAALSAVVAIALGGSNLFAGKTPAIVVSMNDDVEGIDFFEAYRICHGKVTPYEDNAKGKVKYTAKQMKKFTNKLAEATVAKDADKIKKYDLALEKETAVNAELIQLNTRHEAAFSQRKDWLDGLKSVAGVTFASSRERVYYKNDKNFQVNPEQLTVILNKLISGDAARPATFFLELGPLPTILFNRIFSLASLPSTFEGANSANLALNMGSCYLRMEDPAKAVKVDRYPKAWAVNADVYTAVRAQSTAAADAITAAFGSSTEPATGFVASMGRTTGYIDAYYKTKDPTLLAYYSAAQGFFHDQKNDKLGIGLACLNQAAIAHGFPVPV